MSAIMQNTVSVAHAAHKLLDCSHSVVPVASLQTKVPALLSWKPYTDRLPSLEEVDAWFNPAQDVSPEGLGIVCGSVSGGLTVIDFDTLPDGTTLFAKWWALMMSLAPAFLERLPVVKTPSGGKHVYLRCDVCQGNVKLAMDTKGSVLIETRGEGGYVVAPPSPGYKTIRGTITDVPVVPPAVRAMLLDAARSLDLRLPTMPKAHHPGEMLPGHAYDAQATMESVSDVLKAHSWQEAGWSGETQLWRRPGKEHGTSATLTLVGTLPIFYCFSTSVASLPVGESLGPFRLYAHLEHNGDYSAAAKALAPRFNLDITNAHTGVRVPGADGETPTLGPLKTLAYLMGLDLPEPPFVVPGIIPQNLLLLAGAPKVGKSLLCLNIALGVSQGTVVMGNVQVPKRTVIYYALEDGERIVQKRLRRLLGDGPVPDNFYYRDEFLKLDQGALEQIGADLDAHPGALLIVDTFQRIRPAVRMGFDAYQNDANGLEGLAKLILKRGACCILVHHITKTKSLDFLERVSGSLGLTATAGDVAVLERGRLECEMTLKLTGRDYDCDRELAISYDPETGMHTLLGDADEVGATKMQQDIVAVLGMGEDSMTPKQIAQAVGRDNDKALLMMLGRMVDGGIIERTEWGRYRLLHKGNRGNMVPVGQIEPGSDCDTHAPHPSVATPHVTSVTFVQQTTTEGEDTDAAPVQATLMRTEKCTKCGRNTPYWTPLGEGEQPFCPSCAPKKRRR